MVSLIFKLAAIASGTILYCMGEEENKNLKYIMGLPIALFCGLALESPIPILCALTYWIACEIGYGDNNPLTKLVGKRAAITIHGAAIGLAAAPVIGWYCIATGIFVGSSFLMLAILDDNNKVKEPWIGFWRGLTGTIGLLI